MVDAQSTREVVSQPRPVRMRAYLICGAAMGIVAGVIEAIVSSIGYPDFWRTVKIHYAQVGFAGGPFGLACGLIVARRVQDARVRRWRKRMLHGQCVACGYDLRGNVTGRCPECGTPVAERRQNA